MFLSESRLTLLTGCHDAARGIVQCNGIPQPNASNSRETIALTANIDVTYQGRPQDLGGGGPRNFFFRFGNLHVAKRHAAHGEAMRSARGIRGHAPPRNFFKTVQFGAF